MLLRLIDMAGTGNVNDTTSHSQKTVQENAGIFEGHKSLEMNLETLFLTH